MKIFGVGMNYLQHNKELHGALFKPEEPVIFLKADSALLKSGKPFFVPDWSARTDYEGEIVLRIGRLGKTIPPRFAHRYVDGVTVGIDFTARDWQEQARKNGLPWTICKGFDASACIGSFVDVKWQQMEQQEFSLVKNGTEVQHAKTSEMLYGFDELISYISRFFTLRTGDLIFTGTPAGVGPVAVGDHLEGFLNGQKVLDCKCK